MGDSAGTCSVGGTWRMAHTTDGAIERVEQRASATLPVCHRLRDFKFTLRAVDAV